MHISKNEMPIKVNGEGAIARQAADFGKTKGGATIAGEHFAMARGTDISPVLQGFSVNHHTGAI